MATYSMDGVEGCVRGENETNKHTTHFHESNRILVIATLSKPRASSDEYGDRTFNIGHEAYQDA